MDTGADARNRATGGDGRWGRGTVLYEIEDVLFGDASAGAGTWDLAEIDIVLAG